MRKVDSVGNITQGLIFSHLAYIPRYILYVCGITQGGLRLNGLVNIGLNTVEVLVVMKVVNIHGFVKIVEVSDILEVDDIIEFLVPRF